MSINRVVFMETRKGMLGLKQAGKLDDDRLRIHLEKIRYFPVPCTPSLWKHE